MGRTLMEILSTVETDGRANAMPTCKAQTVQKFMM